MARDRRGPGEIRPAGKAQSRGKPPRGTLRIVGGRLRGRRLTYLARPGTRPMKDRVRQAVFNLLGAEVEGKEALDLFAGSGALGLEAVSRGASRARLVERHFPTANEIRTTAAALGAGEAVEVIATDAFSWAKACQLPAAPPTIVFLSPPYDYYVERAADMLELIGSLSRRLPPGSFLVVEADQRFDPGLLPAAGDWDVRRYGPTLVAIRQLSAEDRS